jgi:PAS domain S-box-containing protein
MTTPKNSGDEKQFPGTALAGEPRYRNLVDNALIVIADVSVDGDIIYGNRAGVKMLGYDSLDELRKENIIKFWNNPEQREGFIAKLRQDGYVNNYEIDYLTKSGRIVYTLASAILDGDMISMVIIDVTARKKADVDKEKLLHNLGERLAELECMYAISNSIATKESLDEIFQDTLAVIPAAWQYPEITRGKLRYKDKEWISDSFKETEWKQSSDIVVAGKPCGSVEVYYLEERPTLDEGPFKTEERNLIDGIAHTLSETLERRQAEEKMQESRALFDSYVAVAPVGIAVLDTDLKYSKINETLADIHGVSIDDHLGKCPSQIIPGRLGREVDKRMQDVLRTHQPTVHEELSGETRSQPGISRWWLASYFPVRGVSPEPTGVGAIVVEITEAKRLEEQLRQSQKMEALGTLAGGVAHDINNMLYPVLINAQLLLDNVDSGRKEYPLLTDVIDSAKKIKDLVSQILVFGRHGRTEKGICDFVLVAKDAMKLLRPALPKTIEIELNLSIAKIPVLCDTSQLYQVLVNLFSNAEQAISGSGKIEVALDTANIEKLECIHGTLLDGSFARLTVADSGVGMDDETRARMFDPFFTTKDAAQGTGLGLSTVFGIVQKHGGGITVSSELGAGTTVVVLLPMAEDVREESPDAKVDTQDDANNENILFVDDVESIRKSARTCLERSGYSVLTVSSGPEALEIFLADPDRFDLVMTDQTMPNMTGEELSIELLRHRPDLPIIICTGHSEVISPETSREKGIRAFLQKPATPTELRRVVRDVLDEAGDGQSS